MEEKKNLEQLTAEISNQLFDSITLLKILEDALEGKRKEELLVTSLQNKINQAFNYTETCRQMISLPDYQ